RPGRRWCPRPSAGAVPAVLRIWLGLGLWLVWSKLLLQSLGDQGSRPGQVTAGRAGQVQAAGAVAGQDADAVGRLLRGGVPVPADQDGGDVCRAENLGRAAVTGPGRQRE